MQILLVGLVAFAGGASAQEPTALTAEEAVARALEANAQLAVQAAELAATEAEAKAAGRPEPLRIGLSPATIIAQLEAAVSSVLDLSGRRRWASRAARHELAAAVAGNEEFRLELAAATRSSYTALRLAQERVTLAGEQAAVVRRTRDAVARLVEVGMSRRIDLDRAETALREAELEQQAAEAEVRQSEAGLATLLALPPETALLAADPLPPTGPPLPPGPELQARALAARPAMVRMDELARAALAQVGVTAAERKPDLELSLEREEGVNFGRALLDFPLVDFGTLKHGKRAARARAEGALAEVKVVEAEIREEVQSARDALAAAAEREAGLTEDLLPRQADVVARLQRGQAAGSVSLPDVLEAQSTLNELRAKWLEAVSDRLNSQVRLERSLGAPLEATVDGSPGQ